MKQLLLILDAGHGGVVRKDNEMVYTTAPAKMFDHGVNGIAYEGVHTRRVCEALLYKWTKDKRPYIFIESNLDLSLESRILLANQSYQDYRDKYNCIFLSIHLNAGGGTGFEVYTSPGQTRSDLYAEILADALMCERPDIIFRPDKVSDSDLDKESRFKVLVDTLMPAVLVELLFFDVLKDWNYIRTVHYPEDMGEALYNGLVKAEEEIQ